MKPNDTYDKAIATFGPQHQILKFREECAEAIVAMAHFEQNRVTIQAVIDEVADVLVTAEMARRILGREAVDAARQRKLDRLLERIGEAKMMGRPGDVPPR